MPFPIFILASPRSFTSLVCAMLGQHPEAYGVPEINLMTRETMQDLIDLSQGKRRFILHGLLRTVAQLYGGEQTMSSVNMANRWVDRRRECFTADVYHELIAKVQPLRIVDKSPSYCKQPEHLRRLANTFPDAHYLYLTRHPRQQGLSMLKAPQAVAELLVADSVDYDAKSPIIDPQFDWYRTQCRILEFLQTIPKDRQLFLRGEDLLNEPENYLKKICHWLGLTWSDAAYEEMLHPENSPYACMGPYKTEWGNNPGFQKSPAFRQRSIKSSSLKGPLSWRADEEGFRLEVAYLAQELGYE